MGGSCKLGTWSIPGHTGAMVKFVFYVLIVVCFAALILNRDKVVDVVQSKSPDIRPEVRDIEEIRPRITSGLTDEFAQAGLAFGAPVFLRIFKEEQILELWVQGENKFQLFRSYPICNHSGDLGPKLKEGDRQSPEGIYKVGLGALNPNSRFHLSFNLGFPNSFDRANGRTGSWLMVHGDCVSIGCYAMTDPMIEEIYVAVEAALRGGQDDVPVHAFPFRLTEGRLNAVADHRWIAFWRNLQPIFAAFEQSRIPPDVGVDGTDYVILASN